MDAVDADNDGNGDNLVQLTADPESSLVPSWCPDGAAIAFVSDRSARAEIWLMAADGSGQVQITPNSDGNNFDPDWSP